MRCDYIQMNKIKQIVKEALEKSYLSLEAEEKLRLMLNSNYDLEDLEAFMNLQQALSRGKVRQQSREIIYF